KLCGVAGVKALYRTFKARRDDRPKTRACALNDITSRKETSMKWVYASVVAVATGVCSAASSQSIQSPVLPSLEPGKALFQTVQYDAPNYDDRYDNDDGNRDFGDNDRARDAG